MYTIFVFQATASGSNLLVRLDCFPKNSFDELGAAYGLFFLDLVQTACTTSVAWSILCAGWGDPTVLMHTGWGFALTPVVSGLSKRWFAILYLTLG